MIRVEVLEPRDLCSRYTLTDLGDFRGLDMNAAGLVGGTDTNAPLNYLQQPALWRDGRLSHLPLPASYTGGGVQALDDLGQAAGWGWAADHTMHALFWDQYGEVSVLEYGQAATAINDHGLVAGYLDATGLFAVWQDGIFQGLYGSGSYSFAAAANDAGQLTGFDGGPSISAFRWQNGIVTNLPGGTATAGMDINAQGDVAGYQSIDNHVRAVLWPSSGGIVTLDTPAPFTTAQAVGLNDLGRVVGWAGGAINGQSVSHATLWNRRGPQDLNALTDTGGLTLTDADRINDRGVILATAHDDGGDPHSVLLTPVEVRGQEELATALSGIRKSSAG